MAKRNLAALLLAGIVAMAVSAAASADEPFTGADGCAVLAQLVYSEVTAAAWRSPGVAPATHADAFRPDISICNRTARTVSNAYTLAMSSLGTHVQWDYPPGDRGDYCWSGFLDQCYPRRSPLGGEVAIWAAVSNAVRYAMPSGSGSDQSVFSKGAMRLSLRSALQREDLTQ